MDLLVFDMSGLTVEAESRLLSLRASTGELIFSALTDRLPPEVAEHLYLRQHSRSDLGGRTPDDEVWLREAVFAVFDLALGEAEIFRVDITGVRRTCRLGLYNPYTGDVAVDSVPVTRVFRSSAPVATPPEGVVGREYDGTVTLETGQTLAVCELSFTSMSRKLVAHSV